MSGVTISADGATSSIYIQYSGGNLQYSTDQASWTTITTSAGITITNSNASPASNILKVLFTTDITLSDSNYYFICGSAGIQFGSTSLKADGTRPTITLSLANWNGLVKNGTSGANGYTAITICNLVINGDSALLISGQSAGWFTWPYFGKGSGNACYVLNCSSSGPIIAGGGGICGGYQPYGGSSLTIIGCSSSGAIGQFSGGIIARYGAGNGVTSTLLIKRCFSTGQFSSQSGGGIAGANLGSGTFEDCYYVCATNTYGFCGGIIGSSSGGIGSINVNNCYSSFPIVNSGGGIVGYNAGSTGVITVTNCYSTGSIDTLSGGIFGSTAYTTNIIAYRCYTTGACSGLTNHGIYTGEADNVRGVGNFAESSSLGGSGWRTSQAQTTLSPISKWLILSPVNSAFQLANMGYSPYSIDNISNSTTLRTTESASVVKGNSTAAAIQSGQTFLLYSSDNSGDSYITVDASTGVLTTDPSTPVADYTLVIYNVANSIYNVTTYTLTVTENPYVPPAELQVLDLPNVSIGAGYEYYYELRQGSEFINDRISNARYQFKSHTDYVKYLAAKQTRS